MQSASKNRGGGLISRHQSGTLKLSGDNFKKLFGGRNKGFLGWKLLSGKSQTFFMSLLDKKSAHSIDFDYSLLCVRLYW